MSTDGHFEQLGWPGRGALHHVELWVADLDRAVASLGWLLEQLGYELFQQWPAGRSWRSGATYVVAEQSPDVRGGEHDRLRPGLNHLAFHAGDASQVDELAGAARQHGWRLMFADRHPHAGGPEHYAAYLENDDGFEVELVARSDQARAPLTGQAAAAPASLAGGAVPQADPGTAG